MKIIPDEHLPNGEPQVMALVTEALAQSVAPPSLKRFAPSSISADTPHAILEIGLQALAEGQRLAHAQNTGVRYLLRGAKTQVAVAAVADVGLDKLGTAVNRVTALTAGDGMTGLSEALARIAAYPSPDTAASATLSLLRCRGLNLQALVLTPKHDPGNKMLFPFAATLPSLKGGAYAEVAFFNALLPEARRVLKASLQDRPDGRITVG